ncbi:MAG TPA: response regulator [Pyrinomonadaceae bacterium]|nr:response regulator [Pyrinomonadaceae bacterium]
MNKIRVVIADDEPLARRGIRQLLVEQSDISVVAEARNGREAVRALRELKPDLLFLDVQMPVLDGFGVLREIGAKQMPSVIFVTAYDEFAVRAFDAHALDYLVKPLEVARFGKALERANTCDQPKPSNCRANCRRFWRRAKRSRPDSEL